MQFTVGFLFAGLGAGARGFLGARASLGAHQARFRSVGGVDIDPEACRDFQRLTGSPVLCADVHELEPAELRAAWGDRAPDAVFLSPPCKGFSRLLSREASEREEYQRLNRLVTRGLFLLCSTWLKPPPLLVLENVPGIQTRGAALLAEARALLHAHGYHLHEQVHDCGEVGGLAQHRRRFLLVARRPEAVPAYVYRPPLQRVRGCGEVLGALPLPEAPEAGPLHRLPRLSWINWLRLVHIPAGGDWRDLGGVVPPGKKRREVFARYDVRGWDQTARTVAGSGTNGGVAVADPRVALAHEPRRGTLGVTGWDAPTDTVRGRADVRTGPAAVADPRLALGRTAVGAGTFKGRPGLMGVTSWDAPAPTVTGSARVCASNAPAAVADPRLALACGGSDTKQNLYRVTGWQDPAHTVTGARRPGGGAESVADPRLALTCTPRAGAYGVLGWGEPADTVTGSAAVDNGRVAVAAPPPAPPLPPGYVLLTVAEALARVDAGEKRPPAGMVPVIASPHDGYWHRPLTTLELAALQGLPAQLAGTPLTLSATSEARRREHIGNAVPVGAGRAIGDSLLQALLAAALGTWTLGSTGIWVHDRPQLAGQ